MIISYEEFCDVIDKHIRTGSDFYFILLKNVIANPYRYCGLFRLSGPKSKLLQNITQSREIKFGDIFEEITTEYIERLGYRNLDKSIGTDSNGDALNVDQFFTDENTLFLVEMKMRDDHDSTKKRGQYENFRKKLVLIRERYPYAPIEASMWFVDDSLVKNRNYYLGEIEKEYIDNTNIHLFYGGEFFNSLRGGSGAWEELLSILTHYREVHINTDDIEVPDFGTSEEIYEALLQLPEKDWNNLNSNRPEYVLLRKELFSLGDNIEKAKIARSMKR